VLVTAVSLLFARLPVHHLLAIVAAALLTSAVFSLGGFLNALFARNMDQVNWVPTFVLTPLTYLGGVFYALSLLPAWARRLTDADPILYMVSTFRYGFLGRSDVSVSAAFALMLALAMGLFGLCVLLLKRGVGVRE
jgi:ABC-2 type transport system permease protein